MTTMEWLFTEPGGLIVLFLAACVLCGFAALLMTLQEARASRRIDELRHKVDRELDQFRRDNNL